MPTKLLPIHPGEHLKEFMDGYSLTMKQLAKALHVSPSRITAIVHGTRGISAATAMRLARYFGTSVQMWTNLQARYESEVAHDRTASNFPD